jgi:hypothetical protein
MNAREELAKVLEGISENDDWDWCLADAEAILAAGYRKSRTITTAEELDALQYGAAVVHDEGWGETIAQRHAEDMRWYVTGCLEYIRPEALLPATIIHEPRFF